MISPFLTGNPFFVKSPPRSLLEGGSNRTIESILYCNEGSIQMRVGGVVCTQQALHFVNPLQICHNLPSVLLLVLFYLLKCISVWIVFLYLYFDVDWLIYWLIDWLIDWLINTNILVAPVWEVNVPVFRHTCTCVPYNYFSLYLTPELVCKANRTPVWCGCKRVNSYYYMKRLHFSIQTLSCV